MKKHSGFTLIELMVVMAIIAILATAGLTAYSNYLKKARDASRVQVARQIMTAVESLANGGSLPSAAQLGTYLNSENFAPQKSDGAWSLGLQFDIDPLHGSPTCLAHSNAANIFTWGFTSQALCVFSYLKFSDGTYAISYPVEHTDNINNFWYTDNAGGTLQGPTAIFGNFIGTNSFIVTANSAGPGFDPLEIHSYLSSNSGPTVVDGVVVSYVRPDLGT